MGWPVPFNLFGACAHIILRKQSRLAFSFGFQGHAGRSGKIHNRRGKAIATVTVGGKRYGKGSSREHSPVAEKAAGIRLVIAENFERIYRQNADNVGLFTSTDCGLIERIRRGEEIDIEEWSETATALQPQSSQRWPAALWPRAPRHRFSRSNHVDNKGPRTLFEKILARHVVKTADSPDD